MFQMGKMYLLRSPATLLQGLDGDVGCQGPKVRMGDETRNIPTSSRHATCVANMASTAFALGGVQALHQACLQKYLIKYPSASSSICDKLTSLAASSSNPAVRSMTTSILVRRFECLGTWGLHDRHQVATMRQFRSLRGSLPAGETKSHGQFGSLVADRLEQGNGDLGPWAEHGR